MKEIIKVKDEEDQKVMASVVDCLWIEKEILLAGTKDGLIFVVDKNTRQTRRVFSMADYFDVRSECPAVRAMNILGSKLLVGTLGSEIYELVIDDLNTIKPFKKCQNILKCHYSPNNSWTNEVWGLCIHDDYIFSCSDDATVRCWSILQKKLLSCTSTNVYMESGGVFNLEKDKRTNDYTDAAKCRAIAVSPSGGEVVVGAKNGTVRVYSFSKTENTLILRNMFRHAQ